MACGSGRNRDCAADCRKATAPGRPATGPGQRPDRSPSAPICSPTPVLKVDMADPGAGSDRLRHRWGQWQRPWPDRPASGGSCWGFPWSSGCVRIFFVIEGSLVSRHSIASLTDNLVVCGRDRKEGDARWIEGELTGGNCLSCHVRQCVVRAQTQSYGGNWVMAS